MSLAATIKGFFGEYAKFAIAVVAISAMFGIAYLLNNNLLPKLTLTPPYQQSPSK